MEGLVFALVILIVVFYFLPAIIADQRKTAHLGSIFLINLFFGWTILGWIAALIWAIVEKPKLVIGRSESTKYNPEVRLPVQRQTDLPHQSGRLLGDEKARRG